MNIEELFNEVSNQMLSDFRKTQQVLDHTGQKGEANEEAVRKFLRQYLPKTLNISTGTLVDSDGEISRQLDIVVSDAAKTPIFYQAGQIRVIPIECVYAVIEVKANLDKSELKKCYENMKSVKSLRKCAFFQGGFLRTKHILYGREWENWPVQYFVFAYHSPNIDSVRENLFLLQKDDETHKRIDMICVLDNGAVYNRDTQGMYSGLPTPNSTIVSHSTQKPLLLFYTMMSNILNQTSMSCFNLHPYIKEVRF